MPGNGDIGRKQRSPPLALRSQFHQQAFHSAPLATVKTRDADQTGQQGRVLNGQIQGREASGGVTHHDGLTALQ